MFTFFFFLNNKSLSPLYRFDVYNIVIYFSFCCFIRRKKKQYEMSRWRPSATSNVQKEVAGACNQGLFCVSEHQLH